MPWALVQGGIVTEITEDDPSDKYHPSLVWRKAGDEVKVGYRLSGNSFVPTKTLSLDELKSQKIIEINKEFDLAAVQITSGYPSGEQLTWGIQSSEALAWAEDNSHPTPFLDGVAVIRGITKVEMRERTLAQTKAFIVASQQLVGRRQRLIDRIASAKESEIDSINW